MNFISRCYNTWQKLLTQNIFQGLNEDGAILWQMTGNDLIEQSANYCRTLRSLKVVNGDRIVIALPKSKEMILAHIAVMALGAIVVPLNKSLTINEIELLINDAQPKLFLCDDESHDKLTSIDKIGSNCYLITDEQFSDKRDDQLTITEVDDQDYALLLYTSGTTGKPKGVPLSHGNISANLQALNVDTWQISSSDRLIHMLPHHHIHGLGLGIYGAMYVGNETLILPKFDGELLLKLIAEKSATLFMGVPTMYHRLLQLNCDFDLSSMRLFISGSAPLSIETFQGFKEKYGYTIVERYGLTETMINSSNPIDGERKQGSVGRPLNGIEIGIFNTENNERLFNDEAGEIRIKGANVFAGYWQADEINAQVFCDGWFCTGDLGRYDQDGYLYIIGRIKELIIVGGTNVTPGEVEAALSGIEGINEFAIAGVPDKDMGERVAAFIVLQTNSDKQTLEALLRERANRLLAAYKRPSSYYFIDAIPRNAMGKVERGKLKNLIEH